MVNNAIEERVREIILDRIPKSRKEGLSNSDQLLSNGLLDSLGVLDVVSLLEENFAVSIDDEELVPEHFDSIESISIFISKKIENTLESGPGTDV